MILIGMPSYDGKMDWQTASSLISLGHLCAKSSVGYGMDVIPGCTDLGHVRNLLAKRFMKMEMRDLLLVDADVAFDAMDAVKLCKAEPDIVFGLYRKKTDRLVYPARYIDPLEVHPSDPDLVRMLWGPTGFMRLRRPVFEAMMEAYPDDWYEESETGEKIYDFFPCGPNNHKYRSEDIGFCEKASAIGIKLWAMQGIKLKHTGTKTWESDWRRTEVVFEESA